MSELTLATLSLLVAIAIPVGAWSYARLFALVDQSSYSIQALWLVREIESDLLRSHIDGAISKGSMRPRPSYVRAARTMETMCISLTWKLLSEDSAEVKAGCDGLAQYLIVWRQSAWVLRVGELVRLRLERSLLDGECKRILRDFHRRQFGHARIGGHPWQRRLSVSVSADLAIVLIACFGFALIVLLGAMSVSGAFL